MNRVKDLADIKIKFSPHVKPVALNSDRFFYVCKARGVAFFILFFLLCSIPSCNPQPAFADPTIQSASWYDRKSCLKESGQYTMANGKELNDENFTCASWDFAFGTKLLLTNLHSHNSVIVEITDRGPFWIQPAGYRKKGIPTLDLSKAAFNALANLEQGIIQVEVEVMQINQEVCKKDYEAI